MCLPIGSGKLECRVWGWFGFLHALRTNLAGAVRLHLLCFQGFGLSQPFLFPSPTAVLHYMGICVSLTLCLSSPLLAALQNRGSMGRKLSRARGIFSRILEILGVRGHCTFPGHEGTGMSQWRDRTPRHAMPAGTEEG